MQIAKDARVGLDKIQDNLSNAVSADEESYLITAEEISKELNLLLAEANVISIQINESAIYLEQSFNAYYTDAYAYGISSEMLSVIWIFQHWVLEVLKCNQT
ncbi:MAG: hypothetical protein HRU38_04035 [Saccharospirillaceae bacterium]|nr:hypothetical protein [Pseudomonadales bacterium]NRB77834.1 hypothetical protein [Saccharospirillaceae bacterium]